MQDEPKIMSQIANLLEPLDSSARSRVLGWAISALDVPGMAATRSSLADAPSKTAAAQADAGVLHLAEPPTLSTDVEDWLFNELDYAQR